MSNVYTDLGSIGASKIIMKSFWFTGTDRRCNQLDQTYTVPYGNYLFTWLGQLQTDWYRTGTVLVNGVSSGTIGSSDTVKSQVGGYMKLSATSSIKLTGTGTVRFVRDPMALLIRV